MIFSFLKRIVPKHVPLKQEDSAKEQNAEKNTESKISKKGFSIIELIFVLAIGAGIIVAALGYRTWINRSKEQTTTQKMANIDTVIEMYRTKMLTLPTELNELIEGPNNPALRKKWGESLANESELKDAWGKEFIYDVDVKGNKYELYSTGSKGESKLYSPASQES